VSETRTLIGIDWKSFGLCRPVRRLKSQGGVKMLKTTNPLLRAACICVFVVATAAPASAQNLLTNPSFDDGGGSFNGWFTFGNAFLNAPDEVALSAPAAGKMFGNFWGVFNVTGILQAFPAAANQTYTMTGYSHVRSADAMIGVGPPDDNWAVMKIAFFDAPSGGNEIGGAEVTIATGLTAQDQWHFNTVTGTAPCGTQRVEALFLYLQPLWDGGAVFVDDATFMLHAPIEVAVDIKPGSCPNSLNTSARGKLPVAILGTMDFDVSQIDVSSLQLECVSPVATRFEDVSMPFNGHGCGCNTAGPDGQMDLTLKFRAQDIAAVLGEDAEQELTLTGNLLDGTPIEGQDCVRVVPRSARENSLEEGVPATARSQDGRKPIHDSTWGAVKRIYKK
jgi:hypothetical protein